MELKAIEMKGDEARGFSFEIRRFFIRKIFITVSEKILIIDKKYIYFINSKEKYFKKEIVFSETRN